MMENIDNYIKKLEPILLDYMTGYETGGHDLEHFKRTMKLALYIESIEGGDKKIIAISSYLHDVHRLIQKKENRYVKPSESLTEIKKIIDKANLDLTQDEIDKILYSIEHHEDYNWDGNNVSDLNTLILQDADNLDAIGAIGIARAFKYAGVNNQIMYDENIPFEDFNGYEEKIQDVSTIHFFHNKLVKLGDNMNTKTAKELAKERIDFINNFIDEFLKEWNVNY